VLAVIPDEGLPPIADNPDRRISSPQQPLAVLRDLF
jgi:hypothetical protein